MPKLGELSHALGHQGVVNNRLEISEHLLPIVFARFVTSKKFYVLKLAGRLVGFRCARKRSDKSSDVRLFMSEW